MNLKSNKLTVQFVSLFKTADIQKQVCADFVCKLIILSDVPAVRDDVKLLVTLITNYLNTFQGAILSKKSMSFNYSCFCSANFKFSKVI
jgi:hypothetical protein